MMQANVLDFPVEKLDPQVVPASDDPFWARRAERACRGLTIIATQGYRSSPLWTQEVVPVTARLPSGPAWWQRWCRRVDIPDPGLILRLLARARQADVVLLYGGDRADLIYLCLAGWVPWIRAPHLVVDAHWQPAGTSWKRALQRLCLRLGRRLLAEVQIHSDEERDLYARHFGLDFRLLRPLAWSSSLRGYPVVESPATARRGIVTGGLSYRDYATLISAARIGGWSLHVGIPPSAQAHEVAALAAGATGITQGADWGNTAFWQRVANAEIFVLCVEPGLQRCAGDPTVLTAMALGAIVVATNSLTSRLYIRHGVNGFIVPEGDVAAWVSTIEHVLQIPSADKDRIRAVARDDGRRVFSEERRLVATLDRASQAAHRWKREGRRSPSD